MSNKENDTPLESIKKDTDILDSKRDKASVDESTKTNLTNSTSTAKEDEASVEKARRSAGHNLIETPWHLDQDSVEHARTSKTVLKDTPIQKNPYINVHHKQLQTTVLSESTDQTKQVESLEAEVKRVEQSNAEKSKQLLALKDQIRYRRKELDELQTAANQVKIHKDNISRFNQEIEEHKEMFVELSGMLKEVDEAWLSHQQVIEEKEQLIEERLNQLSTVKYHISELEEQL